MNKDRPEIYSQLPTKQRFARTLRFLSRISFWGQLVLGGGAGLTLLLIMFSRSFGTQTNSAAIGFSIFLAFLALGALTFRIYWAWRYTQLSRRLQLADPNLHPKRRKIIQLLRLGLLASLIGLLLSFLASELTITAILAKAIAQPQGVAVYDPEKIVRALDIFLILANVNIAAAHFLGSINSLGLLEWITID
jgi:hypothetical protein